jgi:ribosomal-protein-alanine N-acetyltransferase
MRFLSGPRLTLQPQLASHAEEMFRVLSDPALYEFENEPPRSVEWLRERFLKLETRHSPDGQEQWLNWVIRLPNSELIGYVQATVVAGGRAFIAYQLASNHWGRGLGSEAVSAMIAELVSHYDVHQICAVFKVGNHRSRRLLERLRFSMASHKLLADAKLEPDEMLMIREEEIARHQT